MDFNLRKYSFLQISKQAQEVHEDNDSSYDYSE